MAAKKEQVSTALIEGTSNGLAIKTKGVSVILAYGTGLLLRKLLDEADGQHAKTQISEAYKLGFQKEKTHVEAGSTAN